MKSRPGILLFAALLLCGTALAAQGAAPAAAAPAAGKDSDQGQEQPKSGEASTEKGKEAKEGQLTIYDELEVTGRASDMLGIAESATEGVTGLRELEQRPILRPGEVLETVPGLMISQHSGDGKANQYYLRGFNLDHGTDFRITVDDIPVNMPSHGHGQGYSDLNFLIPELVDNVRYKKGLYYADEGDFSAAGAATISYINALDRPLVQVAPGSDGYRRALAAGSARAGEGDLLGAIEVLHNDGPWQRPDVYQKKNGLLRYHTGDTANGFTATFHGYDGKWNSTDQIPLRAVRDGQISRFGNVDPTDGGSSSRYSLAGELRRGDDSSLTVLSAYAFDYKLRLFSNFTYFLEDPVNGDQFEQRDQRTTEGLKLEHQWQTRLFGHEVESELGLQARNDHIHNGIFHTKDRIELSVTRDDRIEETSVGPYAQARVRWNGWLRTVAGLRADYFRFRVDSNLASNSGLRNNAIVSPKLSFLLGPWRQTEVYLNLGYGFHSNDARGTTITVEPRTGQPVEPVSPLVRAKSADLGFRTSIIPNLQTALTFFRLDIASELVFSGDAGGTSPSRPSRRTGFELQNFYRLSSLLALDADYAVSRARFTDFDPVGQHIPGAIESAASMGLTVTGMHGAFGSLRWRYFGPRPLIEDASVRSRSTSLFYLDVGYDLPRNLKLTLEVFNLFNANTSDVDYFYASRLPGEPAAGVNDIHFHPSESRSLRLIAGYRF
ncbi:MAG TPA: TonB-dependent receptor [Thermoanaerobaculia bacterium]|nr:TonB-dependent receptor [Thermoanaerobaculia bacterium]